MNAIGKSNDSDVIHAIWYDFTDRDIRRVDDVRLQYYGVYKPVNSSTAGLLRDGNGNCLAWAALLLDMLEVQGIDCSSFLVSFGYQGHGNDGGMLVKNWSFPSSGSSPFPGYEFLNRRDSSFVVSGGTAYHWLYAEVNDMDGVAGQGTRNPASFFMGHVAAKIGGTYYDPSYGTSYPTLGDLEADAVDGFWLAEQVGREEEERIGITRNPPGTQLEEYATTFRIPEAHPPGAAVRTELIFGCVDVDNAYVSRIRSGDQSVRPVVIQIQPLAGREASMRRVPIVFDRAHHELPLRWRITERHYWAVETREPAPFQRGFVLVRIPMADFNARAQTMPLRIGMDPLRLAFTVADMRDRRDIYYDILPNPPNHCRLFVQSGRLMEVYEHSLQVDNVPPSDRVAWSKIAVFSLPWSEPFRVIARDNTWYFATGSGALWNVARGDADEWIIKSLWGHEDPIRMLIDDIGRDRTYAFTKTQYFEVGPTLMTSRGVQVDWDDPGTDAAIKQILAGYAGAVR
jgi:hypothetical protein